jgi:hypothetical protein
MAQDDLSRSLHSLKIRWIVCLVSAVLFGISQLSSGGISPAGILFALIGFVYSIACLISQIKLLRNLKGVGVRCNYWYALMLVGLIFLFFGVAIEVGCFLLYLRRVYRRLDKTPAMAVAPPPSDSSDSEFQVDSDEDDNEFQVDLGADAKQCGAYQYVTLDSDIKRQPCLNHFRVTSGGRESLSDYEEYEYRIDGSKVFVRLLQGCRGTFGKVEEWRVRDGVVMEFDMRARDAEWQAEMQAESGVVKQVFDALNKIDDIDERIASLQKQTEWFELLPVRWGGLMFFILSKHMPSADARRLFRQELERLKMGISGFTKEAGKLGLEPADNRYGMRMTDGRPSPSGDDCTKLLASVSTLGITYEEFRSGNKIVAVLQELLKESPRNPLRP